MVRKYRELIQSDFHIQYMRRNTKKSKKQIRISSWTSSNDKFWNLEKLVYNNLNHKMRFLLCAPNYKLKKIYYQLTFRAQSISVPHVIFFIHNFHQSSQIKQDFGSGELKTSFKVGIITLKISKVSHIKLFSIIFSFTLQKTGKKI